MRRAPRKAGDAVFDRAVLGVLGALSLIILAGTVPIFYTYWQAEGIEKAQSMTFVTLILFELFFAHACRSLRFTVLQLGVFGNPWLWLATLSSALMMLAVIYIPGWAEAFHVVPLTLQEWGIALAVSFSGFVLVELGKWVIARRDR
jgi:Ca2+-transporting ATPase